ncbi:hypothetical protein AURDEDRAFT_181872, partial [Auricularia subglabra TFB-10046 SS5]
MLPTARNAPSHSRPLARALSGLSTGSGSASGPGFGPGSGDSAAFLQGEWGLTFGERLRVLARTQAQAQPRAPFAMPAPRPAIANEKQLALAPASSYLLPATPAPNFWLQQFAPPLSPNVSLLRPALPLHLQSPITPGPALATPSRPRVLVLPANIEVQPEQDIQRTSRKRKRGLPQPRLTVAVERPPAISFLSAKQVEPAAPLQTVDVSPAPAASVGVHPQLQTTKSLLDAHRDLSTALGRVREQHASVGTVSAEPARNDTSSGAARRQTTRDITRARRALGNVLGRLRERHAEVRAGPSEDSHPLDAVLQEARARRLSASDPAVAESKPARAMQDAREQRVRVLDDVREFDVGSDFETLDVDAGIDLQDIVLARAEAPRTTPPRRDRPDAQAVERFVKDFARHRTRALYEKTLLRHPNRAAFVGSAVHKLLLQGEYAAACALHGWMCDEGFVTSPAVVTALICALNDGEGVLQAMDDMPAHVDEPLLAAALSRLQHSLSPAQLDEVAARYEYKGGRGVTAIMINAHARAGDIAAAAGWLKRYRKLERRGRVLEPAPYAALMAAHLRASDPRAALGVLALMQADDVAPTLAIYNMLLSARPGPKEDAHAAVERAFRVAKVLPRELWARADAC